MKFQIEHTDTFGGQANYCWVNRSEIERPDNVSNLALVRQAKKFAGLTGRRCTVEQWGEEIAIRPTNMNQIVFISMVL